MVKKHCLFCDEIVPIESRGDYDRYIGCYCSPGGSYSLLRDSYEPINALSHQMKRLIFPILSAYIREQTDRDQRVILTAQDLEPIASSPEIPATIEEKGARLLQFLYRHSGEPGEAVVIQPLAHSYNLTYSPNLQELVYIIDKLGNEQLIIREGMSFKLTEKGWAEAAARAGGRKLKPCSVLLSADSDIAMEWSEKVLPRIEQCGYLPSMFNVTGNDSYSLESISESKLIIADLTAPSPEVYFAAGYALGLNIPVIWTMNSIHGDTSLIQSMDIRPLVWDSTEGLTTILQQRLSH